MLLRDLFQILSYGELSNLSISGEGSGEIVETQRDRVTSLVNTALTRIAARRPYKVGYVTIQTSAEQDSYTLLPDADFLIENNPGDFVDTLLKVTRVTRIDDAATPEDEGYDLALNERSGHSPIRSLRVIGPNTIVFAEPIADARYLIEYQAAPTKLTIPHDIEAVIDIHPALEAALIYHVAADVYGAINGETTTMRSKELMSNYIDELVVVEAEDLLADSDVEIFDKLRDRGFV